MAAPLKTKSGLRILSLIVQNMNSENLTQRGRPRKVRRGRPPKAKTSEPIEASDSHAETIAYVQADNEPETEAVELQMQPNPQKPKVGRPKKKQRIRRATSLASS
jgi:hypothetical protein